jgi:hypothetical protein
LERDGFIAAASEYIGQRSYTGNDIELVWRME